MLVNISAIITIETLTFTDRVSTIDLRVELQKAFENYKWAVEEFYDMQQSQVHKAYVAK